MNAPRVLIERLHPGAATHGFRWMTFPMYRRCLAGITGEDELVVFGARVGLEPIGLVVTELMSGGEARLVSVFVHPRRRRQGVGRALLVATEDVLARRGVAQLVAGGMEAGLDEDVRGLLAATQFASLSPAGLCVELRANHLGDFVARRSRWLPRSFEVTPWLLVDAAQRDAIRTRQLEGPWYPEILSPFRLEAHIEPATSLALLSRDEVVGWAIGHRFNSNVVHYSTIFVREDLRNLGVGGGLFFTGLRRHCTEPSTRDLIGRFLVSDSSARMRRMIERRFHPGIAKRARYLETHKLLDIGRGREGTR